MPFEFAGKVAGLPASVPVVKRMPPPEPLPVITLFSKCAMPLDWIRTPVFELVIWLPVKTTAWLPVKFDPAIHWKPRFAPLTIFESYLTRLDAPECEVTRKALCKFSDELFPAASLRKLL